MTSKMEALSALAEARADYRTFVQAVEDDLARERAERLSKRRNEVRDLVIDAASKGANVAELKRAYGTKDYRTIKSILDNAGDELLVRREQNVQAEVKDRKWFEITNHGTIDVWDGEALANLVFERLDDGSIMLLSNDELYPEGYDGPVHPVVARWDGTVILPSSSDPKDRELFAALKEYK